MDDVGRVKSNEVDRYEINGVDLFQMDIRKGPNYLHIPTTCTPLITTTIQLHHAITPPSL